jgi:hypothetical protein
MRLLKMALLASLSLAGWAGAESTNQWYPRGPEGGYANVVGIDPVSHELIAGGIAGAFRYDSQSSVWGFANSGAPTPYVAGIAVTPTATFINSGGYVARSTDGGATWTNISLGAWGANVWSIATTPNAPQRVYVTVNPQSPNNSDPAGGLWVSNDLGSTWTQSAPTSGANMRLVRASPTNADLIFVTGSPDENGVTPMFRSADGGATFNGPVWQTGSVSLALEYVDIAQDPFNASRLVALSAPPAEAEGFTQKSQGGELIVSIDAGVTWNLAANEYFVLPPDTSGSGEPRAIVFDHGTPNLIYFATTWGVFTGGNGPAVLASSGMLRMGTRSGGGQPYDEVDGLIQQPTERCMPPRRAAASTKAPIMRRTGLRSTADMRASISAPSPFSRAIPALSSAVRRIRRTSALRIAARTAVSTGYARRTA